MFPAEYVSRLLRTSCYELERRAGSVKSWRKVGRDGVGGRVG